MKFTNWFETFISEKGLNDYKVFKVKGESGINFIERDVIINAIKNTGKQEQAKIKNTLVKIDFINGDIDHYFNHLAQALAI